MIILHRFWGCPWSMHTLCYKKKNMFILNPLRNSPINKTTCGQASFYFTLYYDTIEGESHPKLFPIKFTHLVSKRVNKSTLKLLFLVSFALQLFTIFFTYLKPSLFLYWKHTSIFSWSNICSQSIEGVSNSILERVLIQKVIIKI